MANKKAKDGPPNRPGFAIKGLEIGQPRPMADKSLRFVFEGSENIIMEFARILTLRKEGILVDLWVTASEDNENGSTETERRAENNTIGMDGGWI